MKKLFTIIMSLIVLGSFAQTTSPCTSSLNISTGQNSIGGQISIGQTDPFWTSNAVSTVNPYGATYPNWNYLAGAVILTPSVSVTAGGNFTFKRCFYVCTKTTITIAASYKCDNKLIAFRLVRCDGTGSTLWSFTPPTNDPQCWTPIVANSPTIAIPTGGAYALEFKYHNDAGSNGGFSVIGAINATTNILSNDGKCCKPQSSCCDSLDMGKVQGVTTLQCGKEAKFCYTECKDAKYDWSVTNGSGVSVGSFTGQGTNCIVLNSRKQLCEGKYSITLKITCNNKVITKTFSFAVTAPQNCVPTYLLSTREISATGFDLTAIPSSSTTGLEHAFVLQEITACGGTTGAFVGFNYYNALGAMSATIPAITTFGAGNNGFNYTNLSKGKCYTLAHYIKCCCQWKCIKKCICFSNASCDNINSANKTMSSTETISDIEFKELPKEIQEAALKNNQ